MLKRVLLIIIVSIVVTFVSPTVNTYNVKSSELNNIPAEQKVDKSISVKSINNINNSYIKGDNVSNEFVIEISKINLLKNVVENVDPSNKSEYLDVIDKDVAHGKYTRLPSNATTNGNVYLFAHRDGEHGFFNRLGELNLSDQIILHYHGKKYVYSVSDKEIVYPDNVAIYTAQSDSPMLTLQTCENGTTQRLIIYANLIEVI